MESVRNKSARRSKVRQIGMLQKIIILGDKKSLLQCGKGGVIQNLAQRCFHRHKSLKKCPLQQKSVAQWVCATLLLARLLRNAFLLPAVDPCRQIQAIQVRFNAESVFVKTRYLVKRHFSYCK